MRPRYLGAGGVNVKSFARIHETNLKKQGVLPLTFANPADYEKVQEGDQVCISDLHHQLKPGADIVISLVHTNGQKEKMTCRQSLTAEHIKWFWAGSALNLVQ
jgi:aconitate hydratase